MRLLHKVSKQYNSGPWLGGVKDITARTMFYMGLLNFFQISAIFYYTTLKPTYSQSLLWISFGVYLGILTLLFLAVMVLEYKFVIPSTYTFQNRQEYLHQNLIRKDLKEILERLKKLEGDLNESRHNSSSKLS